MKRKKYTKTRQERTPYDNSYKELFSNPRMVQDLLEGFFNEEWIKELDFSTLIQLSQVYRTEELRERESDIVWRIHWKGKPLYIVLLLEFQSTIEQFMVVRVLSYLCLLYLDLIKTDKEIKRSKVLPPVLPIVLYSGKQPWDAPLTMDEVIAKNIPNKLRQLQPSFNYLLLDEGRYPFNPEELETSKNLVLPLIALEQSKEADQTLIVVTRLIELLKKSGFDSIKRAYTVYLKRVLKLEEVLPDKELNELHEVQQMLAERVDAWIQRGVEKKAIEDARAMLDEGCDLAFIARITKLSLAQIKALKKDKS